MARTEKDRIKDNEILSKIKIGSKVQFKSSRKKNCNKIGTVVNFRKYEGKYGFNLEKEYNDYTSVIIELDDNGKQINTSPRNLDIIRY